MNAIYMREACKRNGLFLQYASAELRADRSVVVAAVKAPHPNASGYALEFASDGLRADRLIVMAAVETHGLSLEHASWELRDDRSAL